MATEQLQADINPSAIGSSGATLVRAMLFLLRPGNSLVTPFGTQLRRPAPFPVNEIEFFYMELV